LDDTGKQFKVEDCESHPDGLGDLLGSVTSYTFFGDLRGQCYTRPKVVNLGESFYLFLATLIQQSEVGDESNIENDLHDTNNGEAPYDPPKQRQC
jgi:hypothetical protein